MLKNIFKKMKKMTIIGPNEFIFERFFGKMTSIFIIAMAIAIGVVDKYV